MIQITRKIALDEKEIQWDFVRASGPGGQNVNKVSNAAQLRLDLANSPSLPEAVRARLMQARDRRVNANGVLVIDARRFRSSELNRDDAIARLVELVGAACHTPKKRVGTKPTRGSALRRVESKTKRGAVKRLRRGDNHNGD